MQLQYSVHAFSYCQHEGRFINWIILFSSGCSKNLHLIQANVLFAFITELIRIKHEITTIIGCV
jgi:hypothetical protein